MSIAEDTRRLTPEDLLALPDGGGFELIDGQLVERNVSALSSLVEGFVFNKLKNHCDQRNLGWVWPGTNGYRCFKDEPEKVRKPDASFVRRDRLTVDDLDQGFLFIAPDLAVEVLSPNDLVYEIDTKIVEYLRAGVRLVWEINPETRTVFIHRADGTTTKLNETDEISGEDVLEGFRCRVAEFFPERTAAASPSA